MKTLTASQFQEEIINYFESASKMTVDLAKEKIEKQMKFDEYDNSYSVGNVRLFYSSNPKFAEGGIGWYISNTGLKGGSTIKLN